VGGKSKGNTLLQESVRRGRNFLLGAVKEEENSPREASIERTGRRKGGMSAEQMRM